MSRPASSPDWVGPGSGAHKALTRLQRFKRGVFAARHERSRITHAGILFVALTLALGTAAYNAGNNLLFLALALLLTCLLFNGVLAWVNFGGAAWRLQVPTRLRVGEVSACGVEVANAREWTPLCALYFVVRLGDSKAVQEVRMAEAIAPGSTAFLPWDAAPTTRGRLTVSLAFVGSLFPFGFLRKAVIGECSRDCLVRPRRLAYEDLGLGLAANDPGARASRTRGDGTDLLAVRDYRRGDAPRAIHWKATARTGRLMVRDLARDTDGQIEFALDPSAALWPGAQFEAMLAFAATLIEDLHARGRLRSVRWRRERAHPVRTRADLGEVLDQLALAAPTDTPPSPLPSPERPVLALQPAPDGSVTALLQGHVVARTRPQ
ncbi:DUF58 domain-containing protein [Nibricoccus sp. IMCC34717]|uniref:DUF58 domain-containing protein n=1 Tax=Nibricoccus sp. IMCC34717 TaxID=3034021 RepID=UPI0038510A84